jgi:hypothetical protein
MMVIGNRGSWSSGASFSCSHSERVAVPVCARLEVRPSRHACKVKDGHFVSWLGNTPLTPHPHTRARASRRSQTHRKDFFLHALAHIPGHQGRDQELHHPRAPTRTSTGTHATAGCDGSAGPHLTANHDRVVGMLGPIPLDQRLHASHCGANVNVQGLCAPRRARVEHTRAEEATLSGAGHATQSTVMGKRPAAVATI